MSTVVVTDTRPRQRPRPTCKKKSKNSKNKQDFPFGSGPARPGPTHVTFPVSRPTYSFPEAASTGACFLSQSGTVVTLTPVSSAMVGWNGRKWGAAVCAAVAATVTRFLFSRVWIERTDARTEGGPGGRPRRRSRRGKVAWRRTNGRRPTAEGGGGSVCVCVMHMHRETYFVISTPKKEC